MRFTDIDINFNIRYEGHQNFPKILSMNILRGFSDHHMWHQNWCQYLWTSLCQFNFFVNHLHSLGVWFFDIWHLFDDLTSFWHLDIFLKFWHIYWTTSAHHWLGVKVGSRGTCDLVCPIPCTPIAHVALTPVPITPYALLPIPLYPIHSVTYCPMCPHCPCGWYLLYSIPLYPIAPCVPIAHVAHIPCTLLCHVPHCPCGPYPLYQLPHVPIAHVAHTLYHLYPIAHVAYTPCTPYPLYAIAPLPMWPITPVPHWAMSHMGNGTNGVQGVWATWAMWTQGTMGDVHIFHCKFFNPEWIFTKILLDIDIDVY